MTVTVAVSSLASVPSEQLRVLAAKAAQLPLLGPPEMKVKLRPGGGANTSLTSKRVARARTVVDHRDDIGRLGAGRHRGRRHDLAGQIGSPSGSTTRLALALLLPRLLSPSSVDVTSAVLVRLPSLKGLSAVMVKVTVSPLAMVWPPAMVQRTVAPVVQLKRPPESSLTPTAVVSGVASATLLTKPATTSVITTPPTADGPLLVTAMV